MNNTIVRTALVLAVVGAAAAPQLHWHLLSPEASTMTAGQIEALVSDEYEIANNARLDRVECAPIERPPGTSLCEAQDRDRVFGLVLQVTADGKTQMFNAPPEKLSVFAGKL